MVKQDRKSTRLKGCDYSQAGAYFITICVKNKKCALGKIGDGIVHFSQEGKFVSDAWNDLSRHYPHTNLDEFVVMPNHVHGIIIIVGEGLLERNAFNVQIHRPSPGVLCEHTHIELENGEVVAEVDLMCYGVILTHENPCTRVAVR